MKWNGSYSYRPAATFDVRSCFVHLTVDHYYFCSSFHWTSALCSFWLGFWPVLICLTSAHSIRYGAFSQCYNGDHVTHAGHDQTRQHEMGLLIW